MSRAGKRPPAYKVRELLEASPLTDREMAKAVGRSPSTVRRWRTGVVRPTWGDVEKVAEVVGRRAQAMQAAVRDLEEACEMYRRATLLAAGLDDGRNGRYDG